MRLKCSDEVGGDCWFVSPYALPHYLPRLSQQLFFLASCSYIWRYCARCRLCSRLVMSQESETENQRNPHSSSISRAADPRGSYLRPSFICSLEKTIGSDSSPRSTRPRFQRTEKARPSGLCTNLEVRPVPPTLPFAFQGQFGEVSFWWDIPRNERK